MKLKTWHKIFVGVTLLVIGGIAMTYSIRFDDYKNISSTFGTTAR